MESETKRPVLTGELIHEAFQAIEPTAMTWESLPQSSRLRYDETARLLSERLHLDSPVIEEKEPEP